MGATRTRRTGSSTTLGILTTIVVILYLIAIPVIAIWWNKEERKLAIRNQTKLEQQLEICKREQ
jgi:preprotein translocase subunit SecG